MIMCAMLAPNQQTYIDMYSDLYMGSLMFMTQ